MWFKKYSAILEFLELSPTYLFTKYISSVGWVPGTGLGTGDTMVSELDIVSPSFPNIEFTVSWGVDKKPGNDNQGRLVL